jgi:hypothetical protein
LRTQTQEVIAIIIVMVDHHHCRRVHEHLYANWSARVNAAGGHTNLSTEAEPALKVTGTQFQR